MKKALVTGGAGFIGSNLVSMLCAEPELNVIVLDNLSSGFRENLNGFNVTFIEGDVRDVKVVNDVTAGCDVVFHLAASVGNSRSIENPLLDSQVNVLGTLNVLEAARRHKVNKVVFSSSAGIFGELKTLPIREDHPVEPDSPYGVSKLCAEKMCLAYAKLHGVECICLRYFNVYGRNQRYDAYGNVIPIFMHRILHEKPILIYGDGEQTRDFINVRDVAMANVRAALARGISGAFNIASGTRITINALAERLRQLSGRGTRVEHVKPRPGDVRHSLAQISAARDAFGYEPAVGLDEGLQEYVKWAMEEWTPV